ncbi:hypothetical protein FRUB_06529 [Fimbriiglobus ruber]|uniref:Uncharacterized protein n=1 Tax=Fimbriiglobus ruber TaxID=1908690 RepID=A0A225DJQ1_9BACT|nr:hypothetical protein FRUB_06529 [Fimbriiglobus ruber]
MADVIPNPTCHGLRPGGFLTSPWSTDPGGYPHRITESIRRH